MNRKIECEKCRGIGTVLCPQCNGEEVDAYGHKCLYCDGAGIVICHECGGNGTIEIEVNNEWSSMGW